MVRDLEYINNEEAWNDPNFNPEKFFYQTNEERARKKAIDKKKIVPYVPKSPKVKKVQNARFLDDEKIQIKILDKYPGLDEELNQQFKNAVLREKIKENIYRTTMEVSRKYKPSGSS